jgi:hypothetical protein
MAFLRRLVSVFTLSAAAACGAFTADEKTHDPLPTDDGGARDAATPPPGDGSATPVDGGPPTNATIRCGTAACPSTQKCCLPLGEGAPSCVRRDAVCPAEHGELLCSNPLPCNAGEVCCVTAERNAGQTSFDISRSFCLQASACQDQNLQHSMCDLGTNQCPGKACKPYLRDTNDAMQDLDVNPTGYATCQ